MPKAKSNRGARKRVRVSKSGKVKFRHPFTSHLLSHKTGARRRKLRRRGVAAVADAKKILKMLGKLRP
jgi:large subunit ribosomal protein L35